MNRPPPRKVVALQQRRRRAGTRGRGTPRCCPLCGAFGECDCSRWAAVGRFIGAAAAVLEEMRR